MAETVLGFALDQVSWFLRQEYARLKGLRPGLQFISDELRTTRAFLRDVEAEDRSTELQQWVKQVREAAYEIEDVIDEFMLVFALHHGDGLYGRVQKVYTTVKSLGTRHRISGKINAIKSRVEEISARHQRYKLDYGIQGTGSSVAAEDNPVHHTRQRALLLEEADLVGINVPKNELLSRILDNNFHLKVISVVGMGGLGKTTLIRRVYEDVNVKREFQCHAWVTISQTFKIELILREIIRQLYIETELPIPQEVESKDVDGLKAFLKKFLRKRRYIVVLDDMWSIDAWEALKYVLPDSNCRSRVLLTTRIADVASATCNQHVGHLYRMKALSEEVSWTLFCKRSFEDKRCPPHLENVSQRILKKCGGLPLAIVSISGLLSRKSRLEEWEKVYRNLGGELEGVGNLDQLKKILLLSYNDLPYHLKGCLLYTSLYPEDFEIFVPDLIAQWISEGFVGDRAGMSSSKVAEEYIQELVNRSLLQVARRDVEGVTINCYVHDLLREITLSIAKTHGLITTIGGDYREGLDNVRRLVIDDLVDLQQIDIQSKHLRSLVMFRYVDHISILSFLKLMCCRSKLLKVLNLNGSPLEYIPKEVFSLFHLKHLSLRGSRVKLIPKSIQNLQKLEVLDLSSTKVTELPPEVLKLRKLWALNVHHVGDSSNNYALIGFKAPKGIGRLVSLEYLYSIDAGNGETVREIGKLTQLRVLGITNLRREDGKQLCCYLEKLTKLEKLTVASVEDEILDLQHDMSSTIPQFLRSLLLRGRLEKVPPWIHSLTSMTILHLFWSRLTEDQLEDLQLLPNLLEILLYRAYEGERLCFKARGFQRLKWLKLIRLEQLRHVTIEEGAMPHLHELEMQDCKSLDGLPQGIQRLSELQKVVLYDMPKELITELQGRDKGSENYRKIAHVPEILIRNWINGKLETHYL